MNATYRMDGMGGGDRLEGELRAWLRAFDPGELPEAARARAFRDVEATTQSARRFRDAWPRLGLAAAVPLLIVVGIALAALGPTSAAAIIGSKAPDSVLPTPGSGDALGPGTDWGALFGLMATSACMGLLTFISGARRMAARVLFGRTPEEDAPLKPVRLRSMPLLSWLIGALATVEIGLSVLLFTAGNAIAMSPGVVTLLVLGLANVILAVSVPMRYPMRDRSSRLLVFYLAIPLVASIAQLTSLLNVVPTDSLFPLLVAGLQLVSFVAPVALAAGLARRSQLVVRPPLGLAAVLIAVAIGLRLAPFVPNVAVMAPEWIAFDTGLVILFSLGDVALLTAAWVCYSTARVANRWIPRAAAAAGCATLPLQAMPQRLQLLLQVIAPNAIDDRSIFEFSAWWWSLTQLVAVALLAFAFLAGLSRAEPVVETAADKDEEEADSTD